MMMVGLLKLHSKYRIDLSIIPYSRCGSKKKKKKEKEMRKQTILIIHFFGLHLSLQPEQIQAEYKVLALQFHPDKNDGDKEAEAKFQSLKVN